MDATRRHTHEGHHDLGRAVLWIGLVLSLVIGSMFLAVAVTNSGHAETGGYMIAMPAGVIAALCAYGLRRR